MADIIIIMSLTKCIWINKNHREDQVSKDLGVSAWPKTWAKHKKEAKLKKLTQTNQKHKNRVSGNSLLNTFTEHIFWTRGWAGVAMMNQARPLASRIPSLVGAQTHSSFQLSMLAAVWGLLPQSIFLFDFYYLSSVSGKGKSLLNKVRHWDLIGVTEESNPLARQGLWQLKKGFPSTGPARSFIPLPAHRGHSTIKWWDQALS